MPRGEHRRSRAGRPVRRPTTWAGFNNSYREQMESAGLIVAGTNPDRDLVEIVEVQNHPWFVAVQFHPEFQSKPTKAHPLFAAFIEATLTRKLAASEKAEKS